MSDVPGVAAKSIDCEKLVARVAAIETELARIKRELEALARAGSASKRASELKIAAARVGEETAAIKIALSRPADTVSFSSTPLSLLRLESQQLTLIKGIDAKAAALLNELGIHQFADIAALTPEDVAEIGQKLGSARRITKEGWIEQAAILASGVETAHARRVRAGELTCVVAPPTGAEVIDLAARRNSRVRGAMSRTGARIRAALTAAAAAAALIVALNATGAGSNVLAGLGIKSACASTLSQIWIGCKVADRR